MSNQAIAERWTLRFLYLRAALGGAFITSLLVVAHVPFWPQGAVVWLLYIAWQSALTVEMLLRVERGPRAYFGGAS